MTASWPSITVEPQTWHGSRPYESAVPAFISSREIEMSCDLSSAVDEATEALIRFDEQVDIHLAPVLPLVEAIASSAIEGIRASSADVLGAAAGSTAELSASAVAANIRTTNCAVDVARELSDESILTMHLVLMEDDPNHVAGEWRDQPVWIGNSLSTPVSADYVAPDSDRIDDLTDDLIEFTQRLNLPRLAQAAVAHAQFETIHPFTDGNGRVGRALTQSVLRGTGVTTRTIAPLSAGLRTDIGAYYRALTAYRGGDIEPIIALTADAVFLSLHNARTLLESLARRKRAWTTMVEARRDSGVWPLLNLIAHDPVITAVCAARHLGVAPSNAYSLIHKLEEAGVLTPGKSLAGARSWVSSEITSDIDDFGARSTRRG